jgi:(4S)-4-hydroxy-5-phosphonooxypentane-2,3-dione isomerase
MYVVVAQWYAKAGKDDEIARVLKTAVRNSRSEPGCALFMANRSVEDPRRFVLYEQFTDEAAFQAHMATESFKTNILGTIVPLLESRERQIYSTIEP